MTDITLRAAKPSDAADLAILDNLASHGISAWFWQRESKSLEEALCKGRARFAKKDSVYGWINSTVAVDEQDSICGTVCGYVMPEADDEVDEIKKSAPAMVPIFELFDQITHSWLIDSLAVYPTHQGKGIASKLLDDSLDKARLKAQKHASLVVEDSNQPALKLYLSRGFEAVETRAYVEFDGPGETKFWQLMTAQL